jgi:integrase
MGDSNSRPSKPNREELRMPTPKAEITTKNYLTVTEAGDYSCGNNLVLIVAPTGSRRWSFNYERNGVKKKMGLGSAKEVTFIEAKDRAIDARRLLAKNIDPKEARDENARVVGSRLFGEFADEWRVGFEPSLKHPASKSKLAYIVAEHTKPLHKMRVDHIEAAHIIRLLASLSDKVEVQRDVRQRLGQIFNAAIAHKLRTDNPADFKSKLLPLMGKPPKRGQVRGSHKAVPYEELSAVMQKIAARPELTARAIEVNVATVARTIETRTMRWDDLDLKKGEWVLAGKFTKNGKPKKTPLPQQPLAYLREAYEERVSEFVFPGRSLKKPISNMAMLKALKEITGDETLTVHGFRSTFRNWAREETDFAREDVEHCMHHLLGDAAELAYKTAEALKKRRVVLQAFADFAMKGTKPSATVIPMTRNVA